MPTHSASRAGYRRYSYRGHIVEASSNETCLPCYRWGWDGPSSGHTFTFRGVKVAIDRYLAAQTSTTC